MPATEPSVVFFWRPALLPALITTSAPKEEFFFAKACPVTSCTVATVPHKNSDRRPSLFFMKGDGVELIVLRRTTLQSRPLHRCFHTEVPLYFATGKVRVSAQVPLRGKVLAWMPNRRRFYFEPQCRPKSSSRRRKSLWCGFEVCDCGLCLEGDSSRAPTQVGVP